MSMKLTQAIEQAIQQCKDNGNGEVCLMDTEKTVIYSEWTAWEVDEGYDVIEIQFYQAGIFKFSYQVEETKVLAE